MKFKILNIPEGEAPLEIRECWVSVTLPVLEVLGPRTGYGVLTSNPSAMENAIAVSVKDAAIALFLADRPTAARWWLENYDGSQLLFEESWGEWV